MEYIVVRNRLFITLTFILLNNSLIAKSELNSKHESSSLIVECISVPIYYKSFDRGKCVCDRSDIYKFECIEPVTKLKLINLNNRILPSKLFENSTALEYIDMSMNRINELPRGLFENNNDLKWINISDVELETVADELFANHRQLEEVNLSKNLISALPEEMLYGATNLRKLDLSSNLLPDLPERIFSTQINLELLNLGNNRLTYLSNNKFIKLSKLIEINLNKNRFQQLPENIFQSLNNLQKLHLQNNSLTSLSEKQFFNLTEMISLDLSFNELMTIPENVFSHQYKIEIIALTHNNLTLLLNDTFINNTKLNEIDLSINRLQSVPELIFRNHSKLTKVYLNSNNLTVLPNLMLKSTGNLHEFHCRLCGLETLPEGIFINHTNMQYVDLADNELTDLSEDLFVNMKDLSEIHLEDNPLMGIPAEIFRDNIQLKIIHLGKSYLNYLPANLFHNTRNLQQLDLSSNTFLKTIPANLFRNLYNLQILDLANSSLTSLPDNVFDNTTELIRLNLESNRLTELPAGIFNYTDRLEIVYLNGNLLKSIPPNLFKYTPKLKVLNLSGNQFTSFVSLKSMKWNNIPLRGPPDDSKLMLGNNEIEIFEWDIVLDLSPRFKMIDLSHNRIRTIDLSFEDFSVKVFQTRGGQAPKTKVLLRHNPLNCDCELVKTIQKLSNIIEFDYLDMECHNLEVRTFTFKTDDFFCRIIADSECNFIIRKRDGILKIDCEDCGLQTITQDLLNITSGIIKEHNVSKCELDIQNNKFETLPNLNLPQFDCLQTLNARNNSIIFIPMENLNKNLKLINISLNKMKTLSEDLIERLQEMNQTQLVLERNDWECDCDFQTFVRDNRNRTDILNIVCVDGESLIVKSDMCSWKILLFVAFLIILAFSICISAIIFFYRYYANGWLFDKLPFQKNSDIELNTLMESEES